MSVYRAYRLNQAGHIMTADWLDADDDLQAEALAATQCGPETPQVELWCGTRRVAVVNCPQDHDGDP